MPKTHGKVGRKSKAVVGGKDFLVRNISPALWARFERRAAGYGYSAGQWNDLMLLIIERWCTGAELAEKGAVVELVNFDPALARRIINYQRYYNVPLLALVREGLVRLIDAAERQWRVKF